MGRGHIYSDEDNGSRLIDFCNDRRATASHGVVQELEMRGGWGRGTGGGGGDSEAQKRTTPVQADGHEGGAEQRTLAVMSRLRRMLEVVMARCTRGGLMPWCRWARAVATLTAMLTRASQVRGSRSDPAMGIQVARIP